MQARTVRLTAVMWAIPLALLSLNLSVAGRFDTRMQDWLERSCRILPKDSLVFVAGDGAVFGTVLGQETLGLCKDVQFVYPRLLSYDWYRRRLSEQGITGHSMSEILTAHEGAAFSVLGLVGESAGLPSAVPFGGYWMQFIPPSQGLPAPEAVEAHLREQSTLMNLPEVKHPFLRNQSAENWPLEQWAHSWMALGEGYKSMGNTDAGDVCFTYADQWLSQ